MKELQHQSLLQMLRNKPCGMNQSPKCPQSWLGAVEKHHREEAGDRHLLRDFLDCIRSDWGWEGRFQRFRWLSVKYCVVTDHSTSHLTALMWSGKTWANFLKKLYPLHFNGIDPVNILVRALLTGRHSFSHSKSAKENLSYQICLIRQRSGDKDQEIKRVLTFSLTSVQSQKFFLHAEPSFLDFFLWYHNENCVTTVKRLKETIRRKA